MPTKEALKKDPNKVHDIRLAEFRARKQQNNTHGYPKSVVVENDVLSPAQQSRTQKPAKFSKVTQQDLQDIIDSQNSNIKTQSVSSSGRLSHSVPRNHTSTFDETTTLSLDDTDYDEPVTQVLATHLLPNQEQQHRFIPSQETRYDVEYPEHIPAADLQFTTLLGPNWRQEAEEERRFWQQRDHGLILEEEKCPSISDDLGGTEQDDGEVYDIPPETPSRIHNLLRSQERMDVNPKTKSVSFNTPKTSRGPKSKDDDEEFGRVMKSTEQTSNAVSTKLAIHTVPERIAAPVADPTLNSSQDFRSVTLSDSDPKRITSRSLNADVKVSDRESDIGESSGDEFRPTQSIKPDQPLTEHHDQEVALKRKRQGDLDYNKADLQSMVYADLDREAFLVDPREPQQKNIADHNGDPISWTQRLSSLSKMQEEDQISMFQSQTDDQWFETGTWFLERLQEDLQRLVEVRLDRRKISLKYEQEVRRRQSEVEFFSSNVEQELKELQTGGNQLIQGRKSSSRAHTPAR